MRPGSPNAPARTAITGMAGRFPGADGPDALWSALCAGTEAVRRFSPAELRAAGVPEDLIADPDYVPYGADLAGIEDFDAAFFGITPAEARLIDPQHRIFLECVLAALEDAGTPPTAEGGRIGVFGGTSLSSYLLHHVLPSPEFHGRAFTYPVLLANDKDFLATRVAYALDLRGPAVTVQSACSSSLVAVAQACAALHAGQCDVAVAGGVSVFTPQTTGHRHQAGGTSTRDGHCRPFDAAASGMVRGSGCGVVVLRRLDDAVADRDHVHAVIAGIAVNNDGRAKAGFTAPGAAGQREAVRAGLAASGLPASRIGYVETHGTGTYLGDPVEIAALHSAYTDSGDPPHACAIGSVKANIGHLDAAAGVTGLIKAALVLRHQAIPPQINFTEPNPELRLHETPFTVHTRLTRPAGPLGAAAVTSLGIGGTNVHAVLTPAPAPPPRPPAAGAHTLTLSAPDEERLAGAAADLAAHLERHPGTRLDDLAHTLAHGRLRQRHRAEVTASTVEEAAAALRAIRDGHPLPAAATADRGDLRHARTIRLPGTRPARRRHWIDLPHTPRPDTGPADSGYADGDPLGIATDTFRARLGVDPVGPDDDFYDLGGDSLHAVELVDTLNRRLGARLTPQRLAALRTPRRVAQWCAAPHDDDAESDPDAPVRVAEGRPGHTPVFLVHPSGGTIAFARALARHITDPGPVHAIAHPAGRPGAPTTVEDMARDYVRLVRRVQPHGPYRLGGYSFGGLVALEMAALLADEGESVERVLLWDTRPPAPGVRPLPEERFLALFPDLLRLMLGLPAAPAPGPAGPFRDADEAIASVRRPDWTDGTVRELRALYETWRVCDHAAATHRPRSHDGPVHLFRAEQPLPDGPLADLAETGAGDWRDHLTGRFDITDVPGDHFRMFDTEHLPALAAAYDRALTPAAPPPAVTDPGRRPVALLFPGQGTQHVGMGRQLLARYPQLVAEADDVLGHSIAAVCAGDPERPLKNTAFAQPALYVVGVLALRAHLDDTGELPAVALGHSVGEYNALEAAGVFTFADGLRLVAARATAMARVTGGGMIAVTGLTEEEIAGVLGAAEGAGAGADGASAGGGEADGAGAGSGTNADGTGAGIGIRADDASIDAACAGIDHAAGGPGAAGPFADVDLAASNSPRGHTLAGPLAALDRLTPVLLAHGARSVRALSVSGPFHSRLMRPAAREFGAVLGETAPPWSVPRVPVVANSTAAPHTVERLAAELVAQIDHTVRWAASLERVITEYDPDFREIGGRRVLLPMVAQVRAALKP